MTKRQRYGEICEQLHALMLMMPCFCSLAETKNSLPYIPIWVRPRDTGESTVDDAAILISVISSCFFSPLRLTWCCAWYAPFHQPHCPFIQTIDTHVTLLPNYNNMDLTRSHVLILTSPPPLSSTPRPGGLSLTELKGSRRELLALGRVGCATEPTIVPP